MIHVPSTTKPPSMAGRHSRLSDLSDDPGISGRRLPGRAARRFPAVSGPRPCTRTGSWAFPGPRPRTHRRRLRPRRPDGSAPQLCPPEAGLRRVLRPGGEPGRHLRLPLPLCVHLAEQRRCLLGVPDLRRPQLHCRLPLDRLHLGLLRTRPAVRGPILLLLVTQGAASSFPVRERGSGLSQPCCRLPGAGGRI